MIVRIRFAEKLHLDIRQIEEDFQTTIAGLRSVPRPGPVSCELWLYSRYGTLRYFRIGDTGIDEADCNGRLPADTTTTRPEMAGSPETIAAPGETDPARPATPPDPYEIFRRYLRKRNAVRKAAGRGSEMHPTGVISASVEAFIRPVRQVRSQKPRVVFRNRPFSPQNGANALFTCPEITVYGRPLFHFRTIGGGWWSDPKRGAPFTQPIFPEISCRVPSCS